MSRLFLILALLVASPAQADPIPPHVSAVVALSYALVVPRYCPAQGYKVEPEAWDVLLTRLGVDSRLADYKPGGRYAHLADIAIGPKAVSFAAHPEGGCANSVDWARHFYPDLAPRLISPPKAY